MKRMKDYEKIHNQNLINKLFEIQISHPKNGCVL